MNVSVATVPSVEKARYVDVVGVDDAGAGPGDGPGEAARGAAEVLGEIMVMDVGSLSSAPRGSNMCTWLLFARVRCAAARWMSTSRFRPSVSARRRSLYTLPSGCGARTKCAQAASGPYA